MFINIAYKLKLKENDDKTNVINFELIISMFSMSIYLDETGYDHRAKWTIAS